MNESKPNSGWNESKPSFPIAMNVGEAMAYASKDKCFWTGEMHTALETLTKEVERLRAELAACQNLLDETRTELSICGAFHSLVKEGWQLELEKVNRLEVELAAAKAVSVWPVGWTEIRTNPGGNVVIYTENHEIAFQLMAWLRDRMKDTTPPEA